MVQNNDVESHYETISLQEITDNDLLQWKSLPESIRNDICFEEYQQAQLKLEDIQQEEKPKKSALSYSKSSILAIIWLLVAIFLLTKEEKVLKREMYSIKAESTLKILLPNNELYGNIAKFIVEGYFSDETDNNSTNFCLNCFELDVFGEFFDVKNNKLQISTIYFNNTRSHLIKKSLDVEILHKNHVPDSSLEIFVQNSMKIDFPFFLSYDLQLGNPTFSIILAAFVLIFLYGLIIWEVVHRTFASVLSSALAIACLAVVNDRPTMREIISYIDFETILLLFCMMIITSILTETGIFNYLAVFVYRMTKGRIWALIHSLCILTTIISAFLDNVTTTLLISPVTITLCETMELDPVPILMMIVIHANIGGTTTPVGDPPNVIITSNEHVVKGGVSFMEFTKFMGTGVVFCVASTAIFLRIFYRDVEKLRKTSKNDENFQKFKDWEEAAKKLNEGKLKEILEKRIFELKSEKNQNFDEKLKKMQQMYPIKDKNLLYKSTFVLFFVISLFLIESVPEIQRLSLSWCALIGLLLLLIISNKDDMDVILAKVEWATLLFFASMFIIMEIVDRLGLIRLIGDITRDLILSVPQKYQLSLAIVIILWVSGIVSAFIDSIPVTAMMVKVVVSIAQNQTLSLPLPPLIWALAFGPCLGGNGTLVGASANVICAGLANQRGYKIGFIEFLKLGFPVMFVTLTVTTLYLVLLYL
ncbi:P protein-like [Culicoides brevitarsis]|uniref:P protein-like n=1 Tax=Culicoides brevitarsis TaxID=469753 RepID=UPI00307BF65A